jgi:hypothetical protein
MALLNGVTLQTNTNIVVPTTTGTAVNGTVKMVSGKLQIYYSGAWKKLD